MSRLRNSIAGTEDDENLPAHGTNIYSVVGNPFLSAVFSTNTEIFRPVNV